MKKRIMVVLLMMMLVVNLCGCTSKKKAKEYGGTTTLDLPKGQKLLEITWKESNIWYLTKPMKEEDIAETYTFQEDSSYGIWEGTIIINEYK